MAIPEIEITVLGSGTSVGVPTIACPCEVCASTDPRDNRLRPSVLVSYEGRNVLIDTTPDFRTQALRAGIKRLDAVLYTHAHADHLMGLDDIRPFNFRQSGHIPIYAAPETMEAIKRCFPYIFDGQVRNTNIPQLTPHVLDGGPIDLFGVTFTPVPVRHGRQMIFGFRFGAAAYLTDHSEVPDSSAEMLQRLDVLFLDALRHKPHPTHSTVELSVQTAARLAARRTWFTHICHDLGHEQTESVLPPNIRLAYDGLKIRVPALP